MRDTLQVHRSGLIAFLAAVVSIYCIAEADAVPQNIVPFRYEPLSLPFLLVKVSINNNAPEWFIVDTGYYWPVAITTEYAKRLHLPLQKRQVLTGTNGAQVVVLPVDHLALVAADKDKGERHIPVPVEYVVLMEGAENLFKSLSESYGIDVGGLVGLGALQHTADSILIDFRQKVIILGAPKPTTTENRSSATVPLVYQDWGYAAKVSIASGREITLLVDTGSYATVLRPGIPQLPIRASSHDVEMAAKFYGRSTRQTVLLSQIALGTLKEKDVVARIDPGLPDQMRSDGLLGLSLLERFRVWIHFREQTMVLEREADYATRLTLPGAQEASLTWKEGHYSISLLREDGPLFQAGARLGDQILTVDGKLLPPGAEIVAERILAGFGGQPAEVVVERQGTKITLRYKRRSIFDTPSSARPTGRIGLLTELGGEGLVITYVEPGGIADQSGLRVGDEIIALNGQDISSLTLAQLRNLPSLLKQGANTFTIKRKGSKEPMQVEVKLPATQ